MYNYLVWPGAYSFKNEIGLFIQFIKEQVDELSKYAGTEGEVDRLTCSQQDKQVQTRLT